MSLPYPHSIGEAFVESFMTDSCVITRDILAEDDDTLDEVTGELINSSTVVDVYEGKCVLQPMGQKDLNWNEGSNPMMRKEMNVLLPTSATSIRLGDKFEVTNAQVDDSLLGIDLRVVELRRSSQGTYRHIRVAEYQQDHDTRGLL